MGRSRAVRHERGLIATSWRAHRAPGTFFLDSRTRHTRSTPCSAPPLTFGSVGIAGLVTTALLAWPVTSAFADDDTAIKRDEDTPDVVLVADDDDDDTADRVAGGGDTATPRSRNTSGAQLERRHQQPSHWREPGP